MADNLVPITDEQAKAIQEALKLGGQSLDTARAFGGYLAKILGTVPADIIGVVFGDALHIKRAENIISMAAKAQKRLKDLGVAEPQQVPLSVGLPLLSAAADENRPELEDLWSRLLAAAMDPSRSGRVRLKFIEVIRLMDPIDAVVLQKIPQATSGHPTMRAMIASSLGRSEDEVEVSFAHIYELGCVTGNINKEPTTRMLNLDKVNLTAFGRELLRALN